MHAAVQRHQCEPPMVLDPPAEFIGILIMPSIAAYAKVLNMVLRFRYSYRATYCLKPYALRALPLALCLPGRYSSCRR